MESHQIDDPVKSSLLTRVDQHKQEITKEVKEISEQTEKVLKTVILVGGSLALTYLLISELTSKRKRKKKKNGKSETQNDEPEESRPSILGAIGASLANHALMIILDIARDKLLEYLASQAQNEQVNGDT